MYKQPIKHSRCKEAIKLLNQDDKGTIKKRKVLEVGGGGEKKDSNGSSTHNLLQSLITKITTERCCQLRTAKILV